MTPAFSIRVIAVAIAAGGCRGALQTADAAPEDVAPPPCNLGAMSDLPGVNIRFLQEDCAYTTQQARAGIHIPYEVTIEQDVDVVLAPAPGTYCYEPDPSGLLILERLTGGSQNYCLCDRGLPDWSKCQQPTTLAAGVFSGSFDWDGVNWSGPSDTANPKGAPFPAGAYRLDVTAKGYRGSPDAGSAAFTVTAAFSVILR